MESNLAVTYYDATTTFSLVEMHKPYSSWDFIIPIALIAVICWIILIRTSILMEIHWFWWHQE